MAHEALGGADDASVLHRGADAVLAGGPGPHGRGQALQGHPHELAQSPGPRRPPYRASQEEGALGLLHLGAAVGAALGEDVPQSRPQPVVDDRSGDGPHREARLLRPPAQVHVLAARERRVHAAEREEVGARHRQVRAVPERQIAEVGERRLEHGGSSRGPGSRPRKGRSVHAGSSRSRRRQPAANDRPGSTAAARPATQRGSTTSSASQNRSVAPRAAAAPALRAWAAPGRPLASTTRTGGTGASAATSSASPALPSLSAMTTSNGGASTCPARAASCRGRVSSAAEKGMTTVTSGVSTASAYRRCSRPPGCLLRHASLASGRTSCLRWR